MRSDFYDEDHEAFRETVREIVARHIAPNLAQWEADGLIDRELYRTMGAAGLVGLAIPEQHGGMEVEDYRFRLVISEELARVVCVHAGSIVRAQRRDTRTIAPAPPASPASLPET